MRPSHVVTSQRALRFVAALLLALSVALVGPGMTLAASSPPNSMDALGDSITRGYNACGFFVDCLKRSWSTGIDSAVDSQYLRILARNPSINGQNYNDAKTGAKMADLATQVGAAVGRGVDYVTVLMGANDACTSSVSAMTPTSTFQSQFQSAVGTLKVGLPNARIFVSSIPDPYRLWQVGHTSSAAVTAWNRYQICQSMLANPTSLKTADKARRQQVRNQVIAYNAALQQVCAAAGSCVFDGNAVFNYPFTLSQIDTWDYFHPNTSGQATLASVTWTAAASGFGW